MTQDEEQARRYIEWLWAKINSVIPLVAYYDVKWMREQANDQGTYFSVEYNPLALFATLRVYRGVFDDLLTSEGGFTERFKSLVTIFLCHEAGHIYLWELEGTDRDRQKIATLVGKLIYQILDLLEERRSR